MNSLSNNRKLTSLDEMFRTSSKVDKMSEDSENQIILCPIEKLVEKHNHKFKVKLGKKKDEWLIESIRQFGVLEPLIVQPLEGTDT